MSSEHQSDSEDADESRDRPNSGSDKEEDPDIDDSDVEDDNPQTASPSRVDRSAPGSPATREREPPSCQPSAAVPQTGSGESSSPDSRRGNSLFSWLQSRTIRRGVFVDPARDNFRTLTSLYCSMNPAAESVNLSTQTHGAVFNLEYSPDG